MKKITLYVITMMSLLVAVSSCFREPTVQGYLGDGICLQGKDTLYASIGRKAATSTAWLDNSTVPVKFEIVKIRDKFGLTNEHFSEKFPTRLWTAPYDYQSDTTEELVLAKLKDVDVNPIMINEVNGQIRVMESTSECEIVMGDVYNVDVKVSNSKGTKYIKDYAKICFQTTTSGGVDFYVHDFVNGICIADASGENVFPYYDQMNSSQTDFSTRIAHVYADDGVESTMAIRKISDEPSVGIKFYLKIYDKNGVMFDPAQYHSYSTTTSYIDYSVNRQTTDNGMLVEFPVTPWPTSDIYSYIAGKFYSSFSNLDIKGLKSFVAQNPKKTLVEWPSNDYADAKGWYARVRSRITFYTAGTYEMELHLPFTSVN